MNYTTTTNIARNGKKEFDEGIKIVLSNNEDIGLIIGKDVYEAMKASGLIDQIREEVREASDPETLKVMKKAKKDDRSTAIDFDAFRKKYDV